MHSAAKIFWEHFNKLKNRVKSEETHVFNPVANITLVFLFGKLIYVENHQDMESGE